MWMEDLSGLGGGWGGGGDGSFQCMNLIKLCLPSGFYGSFLYAENQSFYVQ